MSTVVEPFETRYREHIVLLGKELEFASGIRAFAAGVLMNEEEYGDADALFASCEEMIGEKHLTESYGDPADAKPSDVVFSEGCPFPSLEAYLALRELYGEKWLLNAAIRYAASFGSTRLRDDPMENARAMVWRARARFEDAIVRKTTRGEETAADCRKKVLEQSEAFVLVNDQRRE